MIEKDHEQPDAVVAQTHIKPAFNLFSPAQDEEIGGQSAAAAERELPNDRR